MQTNFFFNQDFIAQQGNTNTVNLPLKDQKLGNQRIRAMVFSEGEIDTIHIPVKIYNNIAPIVYTYKIINTYPHDRVAYTQGLEFYRATLY